MEEGRIEVIEGVKMNMIIKMQRVSIRGDIKKDMSEEKDEGRKYINVERKVMKGKQYMNESVKVKGEYDKENEVQR